MFEGREGTYSDEVFKNRLEIFKLPIVKGVDTSSALETY
jgi:hypothetical protein